MRLSVRTMLRLVCILLALTVFLLLPLPVKAAGSQSAEYFIPCVPVYQSPSFARIIGYLEQGTPLTVLDWNDTCYKIDCYDMVGYIPQSSVTYNSDGYAVRRIYGRSAHELRHTQPISDILLLRNALYNTATAQVGVPYVSGGTTPRGFDCSGFTQYVYKQNGIPLPRSCDDQVGAGIIIPKEALQCGDLVFFQGTNGMAPLASHVGIYLGNGKLIHAGSRGITIVELDSAYFTKHYQCSRRILMPRQESFQFCTDVLTIAGLTNTRFQTIPEE